MMLLAETRGVLDLARERITDPTAVAELDRLLDRLDGPLRVAIAGRVKAGKSTLLNALVGSRVAATDARECTRIVTWYRNGPTHAATGLHHDGSTSSLQLEVAGDDFTIGLGDTDPDALHAIHVFWPSTELETMSLIDTPGVGSLTPDAAARSEDFLGGGDHEAEADAVLYLMKHLHGSDLDLLSAFHDEEVSQPNPINAIGVLSRADEIGAGRPDAPDSAAVIAERIAAEPAVRRLVTTVVPVCGLLAETAATLSDREYDLLAALAALDHGTRRSALLSADRFRALDAVAAVGPAERELLLGRLAMFGLRTSITAIAGGAAASASDLARLLTRLSGIGEVRRLLATVFAERGDVLKARSALIGLATTLARHPGSDTDGEIANELERVLASAHEIAELRMLGALRLGAVELDAALADEAERLVGGRGHAPARRLGLLDTADAETQIAEARRRLGEWQARAEHPLSAPELVTLSRVVIRSCEGLLSALSSGS